MEDLERKIAASVRKEDIEVWMNVTSVTLGRPLAGDTVTEMMEEVDVWELEPVLVALMTLPNNAPPPCYLYVLAWVVFSSHPPTVRTTYFPAGRPSMCDLNRHPAHTCIYTNRSEQLQSLIESLRRWADTPYMTAPACIREE